MGIGFSLFLLTVGALMRFAVDATTDGFDINTAGNILMIVGAIGLLVSLIFWSMPSSVASRRTRRTRDLSSDDGTVTEVEDTRSY